MRSWPLLVPGVHIYLYRPHIFLRRDPLKKGLSVLSLIVPKILLATSTSSSIVYISAAWNVECEDILFFSKGKENFPSSTDEALRKLKLLLKEVVPHLLAKNGSKQHILSANTYLMQQDSSLGLTWKILNRDQLLHNLGWLKITLIESLDLDVFSKVII